MKVELEDKMSEVEVDEKVDEKVSDVKLEEEEHKMQKCKFKQRTFKHDQYHDLHKSRMQMSIQFT